MLGGDVDVMHGEIQARVERGNGNFATVFGNWIKYQNNKDRLFHARGRNGVTYLLDRLARNEVKHALAVLETVREHWSQDQIDAFLNCEDEEDNGVWHYLADCLRLQEGRETLRMARLLIKHDIDFIRRNRHGVSPLGKMLLPEPKWQSINALIQTKHLQIGYIEAAIAEQVKGDELKQASMMSGLFQADLEHNRALLSQHVLKQANQSSTDKTHRSATCRLFFDYVDQSDGTTAFFKLIGFANHAMFEDLLRLLLVETEDEVMSMAPPDVTTKKAFRQALLCRRLFRSDKRGETVFFYSLRQNKLPHLRKMTSLLINDDLVIKKLRRGETIRVPVPVDKTSPAPQNPLLSALLKRNRAGDTLFHVAARQGNREALEAFCYGLPSNDIHALLTQVGDGAGLTLQDYTDDERIKARLGRSVRAGRATREQAQALYKRLRQLDAETMDYIRQKIAEIEELASETKGGAPVQPNFDIKKAALPA